MRTFFVILFALALAGFIGGLIQSHWDIGRRYITVGKLEGESYTVAEPIHEANLSEVMNFLTGDPTDVTKPSETYNCVDFSWNLMRNANREGIDCRLIKLVYEDSNHCIVAFPLDDGNVIYIEPQTDDPILPIVGEDNLLGVYELTLSEERVE